LFIAGEKTGDGRGHRKFLPIADRLFETRLACAEEGEKPLMAARSFRELLEATPADRQRRIEKRFQESLAAVPLDQ
jgi:hypothetical protein